MKISSVSHNTPINKIAINNKNSKTSTPQNIEAQKTNFSGIESLNFSGVLNYPHARPVKIVSFGNGEGKSQNRGLMMHISHLPASRSHIGQFLDPETERFTQFLHDAKQNYWIINPLTPIGQDLSPYNASSRFDRNKYFINLNVLATPEYGSILKKKDLPDESSSRSFTMQMLSEQKDPRFKKAFKRFQKLDETHPLKVEFKQYSEKEGKKWLDNSAIHEGIVSFVTSKGVGNYDWRSWPEELKMLPENTQDKNFDQKLNTLKEIEINGKKLDKKDFNKIEQFRFEQFLFDKQFKGFKKDLEKKHIKLFVDLAYAISPDGKDVWANKDIVLLDKKNNYQPLKLTGCMPEAAYPHTQIWGQAVWNPDSKAYWDYQENSMRKILEEGCVRLDHFGGLINRGAIPAFVKDKNGTEHPIKNAIEQHIELETGYTGIDGKEKTYADKDIWRPEWLEDVSEKKNDRGENLLDMYMRVATESELEPENTFIVEDLGGVCETPTFKQTMEKYGDKLSGLRLPTAYGIESTIGSERLLENNPHSPWGKDVEHPDGFAVLSGSHDPPTLMETVEIAISNAKRDEGGNIISPEKLEEINNPKLKDSSYLMLKLAQEAGMEMKDLKQSNDATYYKTSRNLLEWMYKKPAKHMQTTISDALGIYFRPNVPDSWNGNNDRFLMKQTRDGQFNFWSNRFAKGFLDRDDKSGINAGYKERAQNFVNMMQKLFPPKETTLSENNIEVQA